MMSDDGWMRLTSEIISCCQALRLPFGWVVQIKPFLSLIKGVSCFHGSAFKSTAMHETVVVTSQQKL